MIDLPQLAKREKTFIILVSIKCSYQYESDKNCIYSFIPNLAWRSLLLNIKDVRNNQFWGYCINMTCRSGQQEAHLSYRQLHTKLPYGDRNCPQGVVLGFRMAFTMTMELNWVLTIMAALWLPNGTSQVHSHVILYTLCANRIKVNDFFSLGNCIRYSKKINNEKLRSYGTICLWVHCEPQQSL